VAAKRTKSSPLSTPSRRTQIVWGIFLLATTVVTGLLTLQKSSSRSGFLLTSVEMVGGAPATGDSIFQIKAPLDRERWTGIVIHHLGQPAGDAESVTRLHESQNIKGLGYHFLIGNGNGLGDGVVHVGYRWNEQLAGAHVVGKSRSAAAHNQHSIGICLVGNGDRRPFTDHQVTQLVTLIHSLQRELNIPADHVYLHRDLHTGVTSPGTLFPASKIQEQLLDRPRSDS
jgi:N-acetyl-anhydromuramyl-L-alanine amidase AmpD